MGAFHSQLPSFSSHLLCPYLYSTDLGDYYGMVFLMSDSGDLEKRIYALESDSKVLEAKFAAHINETKATIARERIVLIAAVAGGLIILVTILTTTLLDRL